MKSPEDISLIEQYQSQAPVYDILKEFGISAEVLAMGGLLWKMQRCCMLGGTGQLGRILRDVCRVVAMML